MNNDSIVEEVHRTRRALFERFNHDLDSLVKHLQQKTDEARKRGEHVVSFSPKRPSSFHPAKRAG